MSLRPKLVVVAALVALPIVLLAGVGGDGEQAGAGSGEARADRAEEIVLTPQAVGRRVQPRRTPAGPRSQARVVDVQGAGAPKTFASGTDGISPGAPSDAKVRAELREARAQLRQFKTFLDTSNAYAQTGPRATVRSDGTAVAPADAPEVVQRVIHAGNAISKLPYKWGGGHGAWRDSGYDCSGSVSFAFAGAGLLDAPLTSGGFASWGVGGPGEWITIYANGGHMFIVVAGLRFDTSGRGRDGTRWQEAPRSTAGFEVRHIRGL